MQADTEWMKLALQQAHRAWGDTHPNPMVGAVIVADGEVLATGYHRQDGAAHAEVDALRNRIGPLPEQSCLYVTLEPCSTSGRTGACTDAIIDAGIRRVVIGAYDPNPLHQGRATQILQDAGIEVVTGVLADQCSDLNLLFNHWITRQQPLIAAKVGMTLDACIATSTGQSRWITGARSRADVMRWRKLFPAIAVGAGTVLADNPRLSSRMEEGEHCPLRFVFDRSLSTLTDPLPAVYRDEFAHRTILVTAADHPSSAFASLQRNQVSIWQPGQGDDTARWDWFCQRLTQEGINGLLIEGGPRLLGSFLNQQRIDYLFAYRAPLLFADVEALPAFSGRLTTQLNHAIRLRQIQRQTFGDDDLIRGFLEHSVATTEC